MQPWILPFVWENTTRMNKRNQNYYWFSFPQTETAISSASIRFSEECSILTPFSPTLRQVVKFSSLHCLNPKKSSGLMWVSQQYCTAEIHLISQKRLAVGFSSLSSLTTLSLNIIIKIPYHSLPLSCWKWRMREKYQSMECHGRTNLWAIQVQFLYKRALWNKLLGAFRQQGRQVP